jgi:Fe-S cluster assembly iron-binding protein IscA
MNLIEFSDSALDAIHGYRSSLNIPSSHYLRVGIRQKNAQDKGLLIGFDELNEKDKLAQVQGLFVIYNPGQVFFFAGMIIDYLEQNGRKGFKFIEKSKAQ